MSKGFGYRLRFYLIGFGLGCIMVWAMFYKDNDRRLSTPQGRIFGFIEQVEQVYIEKKVTCQLTCYGIDKDFLDKDFLNEASVDFSKSKVKKTPCPDYFITSTLKDGQKVQIYIETCLNPCDDCEESDRTATLKSIELIDSDKVCDC